MIINSKCQPLRSGEDLTNEKDQTILKRVLKPSDSGFRPRFGSFVEIALKGIQNDQIFDQRNIKFILGEGVLQHIAEGFVIHLRSTRARKK